MKKHLTYLVLMLPLLFWSCREDLGICPDQNLGWGLNEAPMGFPEIPFPEDNAYSAERWELGKKLFFDKALSLDSTISCGTCHAPELAFADDLPTTPGFLDRMGFRNAPTLTNVAYQPYFLFEGSLDALERQVLVPIEEHNEFAFNIVDLSARLALDPVYVAMSQAAYGQDPNPFVITRSISTFERTLVSGSSPWDQWEHQGCPDALSPAQQRGMALFFSEKTQCSQCHNGLNFTTYDFENNGLYMDYRDEGRLRLTRDSADLALFKIPTLRNVGFTAPYMHDGSIPTLAAVVDHYNAGGAGHPNQSPLVRPLGLTEAEKADLVAFLHALDDPAFISDPRFQEQ